jgi:hypothetical protein
MSNSYRYLARSCLVSKGKQGEIKVADIPAAPDSIMIAMVQLILTFLFWGVYGDCRAGGIRFRNPSQAN